MFRRRTVAVALLSMVLCPLFSGCGKSPEPRGEKITLKINLPKGAKLTLVYDMQMATEVSQGSQRMEMDMGMGMDLGVDVVDVDAQGVHTLKVTHDAVRMQVSAGQMSIDYDSRSSDAPPEPAAAFGQLVGRSLTLVVNPDGTTKEVQGVDELVEAMSADQPPAAQVQMRSQLEGMKGSFDQMMTPLPDRPVDIRDTWKVTQTMSANPGMPMTVEAVYTLYDRQNGEAVIKVDGKMTSTAGISGTIDGTFRIDEKTGWTNSGEFDMQMSGSVQGGAEMDMDGTVTVRSK
ncbi:MAG: hypothetical protein KY476_23325 [Planctomycetes bacterium]|nr:hypothetical protein [Planctomycetota bacterium]